MSRRLTETFDPQDFLEFATQGGLIINDSTILDFEANLVSSRFTATPAIWIASDFPDELFVGQFFDQTADDFMTQDLIRFLSDDIVLGNVRFNAANAKLELTVNGVVEAIGTVNIQHKKNWHMQVRYKVSATVGVFELKLDEDLDVITFNGNTKNTGGVYVNRVEWRASDTRFDSLYINDTNGVENNGYDGVVRMKSFVPTADGFWADWLLSAGSDGFAMLNQTPQDGDTTIVYSNVNGDKSSFICPGHGLAVPSEIMAVSARWVVRKVSNGRLRPFFRINNTDYPIVAASVPIGVGYGVVMDRRTTNPDTTLPWAIGDTIDSFGLEAIL
jgi:hypothetical protein